MTAPTTIAAEELVYDIAAELGLTEAQMRGLDGLDIAEAVIRTIRQKVRRHVYDSDGGARTPEAYEQLFREYLLPDPKVIDLHDALERLGKRHARTRPAS